MRRLTIVLLSTAVWTSYVSAQQTASALPPEAVEQLRAEVARLASSLEATREELKLCRDEIHQLRAELQTTGTAVASGAGNQSDSATETAHSLSDIREEQALMENRVGQLYQTKVESGSKYRVRLSGLVLFNTFYNRGTVDTTSVPNLAQQTPPGQAGGNVGATFRQTLFTLQTFGPELAGARTSGEVQFDFYGGFSRALDGYVLGIPHLRTANIEFDWKNWSLRLTQDKPFISPLSPTTLAALGTPEFAYSGNLWTWTPQIIGERTWFLSDTLQAHLQFGMLDPFNGEVPQTFYLRKPEAGELSRTPGVGVRQSWDFPIGNQSATIGAGGYFARQDYDFGRTLDAWAATLDWNLPFGEKWALSGELHRGRGLGGLWGGIGTSAVYTGPENDPATGVVGVNTVGGWTQLKFKPASKWEMNGAFGEESPFASDVLQSRVANYWPVLRNWTTMVNIIDRPRSNLMLSLEYRHLNTVDYFGQTKTAEHINLGVGVAF